MTHSKKKKQITRRESLKLMGGAAVAAVVGTTVLRAVASKTAPASKPASNPATGAAETAPASKPASNPATGAAEEPGSVVQGRFTIDSPIRLDPIRNYFVLPYEITFKEKKEKLLATAMFSVRLLPDEAQKKNYQARLVLMDDEGKQLAEQTAEVSGKALTVTEQKFGDFTSWTIIGKARLTFSGIQVSTVRRFELRLTAH
jgi:hypothetical protein